MIPVRLPRVIPQGAFPASVALFPIVGAAIGASVSVIDTLASRVLPAFVVAALDMIVLIVVSGALHVDGLADTADGLLGDLPREKRLEVMRDPTVGTFGVLAIVLILLIQYGSLISLGPGIRVGALFVAAVLSRWTMSVLLRLFPYARESGIGSPFRNGLSWTHVVVSTVLAGALSFSVLGTTGVALMVAAAIPALLTGRLAQVRIGGCTGDTYGAGGELAFAAVLATIVGAVR